MKITRFLAAASIGFVCSTQPALAQLRAELVASGLSQPVAFVQDPSQTHVQMVVQQAGLIRVVENGVLREQPFLDLTSQVMNNGERGLIGLAFAPDYASSLRFYVHFTNLDGNTVIARFLRSAGDAFGADPSTRFDLVWPDGLPYLEQPWSTHKGGNLVFGPDGYLYIGLGDGDKGNGPLHLAQNPASLLGKMLRIDVSVDGGHPTGYVVPANNPFAGQAGVLPEIWSFGLRNPWRYSFDDPTRGGTGALIVADVGEAGWEEVNYEPAGAGGRNYGWRNREGAHDNILSLDPFSVPLTDPIYEYSHTVGRSITGGFVYRGSALGGGYHGRYFFSDVIRSRLWSLGLAIDGAGAATAVDLIEHTAELGNATKNVVSFGVDAAGELYAVAYGRGEVYRIALDGGSPPPPPPSSSCTSVQPSFDWTCANGNWYPPGMTIPGEAPPPSDPPAPPSTPPTDDPPADPPSGPPSPPEPPSPPPPPPPPVCPTLQPGPDWVCAYGNWFPPGMVIPDQGAPPSQPEPPPPPGSGDPLPPSPPAPPSAPSSCESVQPGSDWTCANGNWYPPGMTIPVGPPAPPPPPPPTDPNDPPAPVPPSFGPEDPPAPTPPSPPLPTQPPPPAVTCATPDPFVEIQGLAGICTDGNWSPTEVVTDTGTARFRSDAGGYWVIEMDDGRVFVPLYELPIQFPADGERVTFTAKIRPDQASAHGQVIEIIAIH